MFYRGGTSFAIDFHIDYQTFGWSSLFTIFVNVKIYAFIFCVCPNTLSENLSKNVKLRGESHIDFRSQRFIMMLVDGGPITNGTLKFRKVIEFESSCIVICFSLIFI